MFETAVWDGVKRRGKVHIRQYNVLQKSKAPQNYMVIFPNSNNMTNSNN